MNFNPSPPERKEIDCTHEDNNNKYNVREKERNSNGPLPVNDMPMKREKKALFQLCVKK